LPDVFASSSVVPEIEAVLMQAASGRRPTWRAEDLAVLHDMIANVLEHEGWDTMLSAQTMWRNGMHDEYRLGMQHANLMFDRAVEQYRAALALDPADAEAQAGISRINR
jgi:hypothetical protein